MTKRLDPPSHPKPPRYDLNLKKFYDWGDMSDWGRPDQRIYRAQDGECRLDRYLLSRDQMLRTFIGQHLAKFDLTKNTEVQEMFGEIVGIETEFGYWVVTHGENIDIFRGETSVRPVRLES